jgi:hypothetical protein
MNRKADIISQLQDGGRQTEGFHSLGRRTRTPA